MTQARTFLSLSVLAFLALTGPALAGMELNGVVATENYIGLRHGEFYDFRNANWFELKVQANPHDQVSATASLELRNTNFSAVQTIDQLWDRGTLEPVSWRINQAYMDLYGFLFDGDYLTLDLRVGKQNLAWGEGDGFNPSNFLDPYNLESPHDFDQRLGNVSMKAAFVVGDEWFTLEAVAVPRFLPSVLPVDLLLGDDLLSNPLMPQIPLDLLNSIPGVLMRLVDPDLSVIETATPEAQAANIMGGARLLWSVWGFDWSLSYAHARETIPVVRRVQSSMGDGELPGQGECPTGDHVSCIPVLIDKVELIYPKVDVVGINLRGSIWDIGVWAEAAVIFPQAVDSELVTPLGSMNITSIEDEAYTKWVLGAEYTFNGGYYFNLQWIHGFFTELTGHALHDYLFLVLRKSVLSDRLKFEVSLGGELDTTTDRRALGGLARVTMAYKPFDGSEIVLGYMMARGEEATSFEMFENLDQAIIKFRADF